MNNYLKSAFIVCLSMFAINTNAQNYLDQHFNKVKDKSDAWYYRVADTSENEIIEKTFYISDTLYSILHLKKLKSRVLHGKYFSYYPSGNIKYSMEYSENKLNGQFIGYYENGQKRRIDYYKNDSLIEGRCFTNNGSDTTYFVYSRNAKYEGQNIEAFQRFVYSKLSYPRKAYWKHIQGLVKLEFCVNKEGRICDIKVIQSPDESLSQEAIKVLNQSKIWSPGIFEGKPTKQQFTIPINFRLDKD